MKNGQTLIMPGRALFIAALAYMLLGCGAFFSNVVFAVWLYTGIALLPFVILDALFLLFLTERFTTKRELPATLAQGEETAVKLHIRRSSEKSILPSFITVYDLCPPSMETNAFPVKIAPASAGGGEIIFEYSVLPADRGPWTFTGIQIIGGSPLRFWRLRVTHNVISSGRTYPDFKKIAEGRELRGFLERGEVREIRRRGQGMEFESLRDYQQGDPIRWIDWRATSRGVRRDGSYKYIVKNFQEEQEQQVLFILDSGYRLPDLQFDNALNATLLLSYAALKHGDAAGAATFGAQDRWIRPRKGSSALTGLLNGLYDLHSAPVPSSPFQALENALARLQRRSLIMLISNFSGDESE
ncbi:MAG: DUF58 domain-containing protein, partial [Treponema sp.]|nr:DUF58 domain-containing protein [Treponema sp.]